MLCWLAMRQPDIWTGHDLASRLALALLSPLGQAYAASVAYRAAHTEPYRSSASVVCVGNLTVGGTGKTPIAMEIARLLIARGRRTVFLTRGYGGRVRGPAFVSVDDRAIHVGDEPLLLATVAPVIVSRDRAAGARLADEHAYDCIVMDDGHQNFSLAKHLSIVVVDAEAGFGNNRVLPAGPLRETGSQGLARADAIIINGDGNPHGLAEISIPTIHARLAPTCDKSWSGKRAVAFAGIGRPAKFFGSLAALGAQIVEARPYGDHHIYTQSEIARLKARARAENATLVTTEKDYMRLTQAEREGIDVVRVRAVFDDRALLDRLLDRLVMRGLPPQPS
jgi:tetraacyldisaccharide 4'-kinase